MKDVFGAKGQLVVGVLMLVGSVAVWAYGTTLSGQALIRLLFHVSMAALVFAAYGVIVTALGYRKTEVVETAVVNNIEHADEVKASDS